MGPHFSKCSLTNLSSTLFTRCSSPHPIYRIDLINEDISSKVTVIDLSGGSLRFGDGLEFLSPTKIVVAGRPSSKLVESSDGWRKASVTGWFSSRMAHRLVSSPTVKE